MNKWDCCARTIKPGESYFFKEALALWNLGKKCSLSQSIGLEERKAGLTHVPELMQLTGKVGEDRNCDSDLVVSMLEDITVKPSKEEILDYCEKKTNISPSAFIDLCMILNDRNRALQHATKCGRQFDIIKITESAFTAESREVLFDDVIAAADPSLLHSDSDKTSALFVLVLCRLIATNCSAFYRPESLDLYQMYLLSYEWDAIVLLRLLFPQQQITTALVSNLLARRPYSEECMKLPCLSKLCWNDINGYSVIDSYRMVKLKKMSADQLGQCEEGFMARAECADLFRTLLVKVIAEGNVEQGSAIARDLEELLKSCVDVGTEYFSFYQRAVLKAAVTLLCGLAANVLGYSEEETDSVAVRDMEAAVKDFCDGKGLVAADDAFLKDPLFCKGFLSLMSSLRSVVQCEPFFLSDAEGLQIKDRFLFVISLANYVMCDIKDYSSVEELCKKHGVSYSDFTANLKSLGGRNGSVLARCLVNELNLNTTEELVDKAGGDCHDDLSALKGDETESKLADSSGISTDAAVREKLVAELKKQICEVKDLDHTQGGSSGECGDVPALAETHRCNVTVETGSINNVEEEDEENFQIAKPSPKFCSQSEYSQQNNTIKEEVESKKYSQECQNQENVVTENVVSAGNRSDLDELLAGGLHSSSYVEEMPSIPPSKVNSQSTNNWAPPGLPRELCDPNGIKMEKGVELDGSNIAPVLRMPSANTNSINNTAEGEWSEDEWVLKSGSLGGDGSRRSPAANSSHFDGEHVGYTPDRRFSRNQANGSEDRYQFGGRGGRGSDRRPRGGYVRRNEPGNARRGRGYYTESENRRTPRAPTEQRWW